MAKKIGIVVSRFNDELTDKMADVAVKTAKSLGYRFVLVRVPGVYDIPYAVLKLLERKDIAGVATSGADIQGETHHDEVIGHANAHELTRLSTRFGKPVTLGVIGPGAPYAKAKKRVVPFATHAVKALDELLRLRL